MSGKSGTARRLRIRIRYTRITRQKRTRVVQPPVVDPVESAKAPASVTRPTIPRDQTSNAQERDFATSGSTER